jgi:predicted transcriptional regulator of viral defense system
MALTESIRKAVQIFRRHGGLLRTSRALELGIHPRSLYGLRDSGQIVEVSRGVYRLASLGEIKDPDLVTVAVRIPKAIICLISALHFHNITTQIPHAVDVAVPRGTKPPRLDHPPLRLFRFSEVALTAGIETHTLDGVSIRIFSAEKTVADCFKFRNKIGLDVAVEGLKLCMERKRSRPQELLQYAQVCRVQEVMRPYLEALL